MAGVTGINANTANLVSQLLSTNSAGKKSQLSSSFNITTNTTSSTGSIFGLNISKSTTYKLDVQYFNDGTGNKYNTSLPAYTGLTKGEPSLSEDELRDAIVSLAKEASASGKDYTETVKQAKELINKHICSVSPDRAGVAANGSVSVPGNCNNFIAKIVDENNGDNNIGIYQANFGVWMPTLTQTEIDASRPFADLFYNTFYGLDSGDSSGGSSNSKVDYTA